MTTPDERGVVRIKSEPISPNQLPTNHTPLINVKRDLGSRLASFKPPRDLSLSSTSQFNALKSLINPPAPNKKVFVPNFNVSRRKTQSTNEPKSDASKTPKRIPHDVPRKPRHKGNFVQTQGVFSEGLAKATKDPRQQRQEASAAPSRLEKPKLNLNKTTDKKKEDIKMKDILKDDFLDDDDVMPDLSDPPLQLPLLVNSKNKICSDVESTFNSLQIKTERRTEEEEEPPLKMKKIFDDCSQPQLLVFDFPPDLIEREIDKKSGKEGKKDRNNTNTVVEPEKQCTDRLSKLGEGRWGTLKFLANGNAYMSVGNEKIPIHMVRYCPKQVVMSVNIDENSSARGELVNLGRVAGNIICSSDVNLQDSKVK